MRRTPKKSSAPLRLRGSKAFETRNSKPETALRTDSQTSQIAAPDP